MMPKTSRMHALIVPQQGAMCFDLLGRNTKRLHKDGRMRPKDSQQDFGVLCGCTVIFWPKDDERRRIRGRVFDSYHLRKSLGVDGYYTRILGLRENELDYVNRKDFHSINFGYVRRQVTFRCVSARFPEYSRFFKKSQSKRILGLVRKKRLLDCWRFSLFSEFFPFESQRKSKEKAENLREAKVCIQFYFRFSPYTLLCRVLRCSTISSSVQLFPTSEELLAASSHWKILRVECQFMKKNVVRLVKSPFFLLQLRSRFFNFDNNLLLRSTKHCHNSRQSDGFL